MITKLYYNIHNILLQYITKFDCIVFISTIYDIIIIYLSKKNKFYVS